MFLHLGCNWVALVMIRHRLSPRAKHPISTVRLWSSTASFRQERPNFPRPLFPSNLPWQGTLSLLTDCAQHCSLLRPRPPTASLEITALHRDFSPINFCIHSRRLRLHVATNGYARDNGPSIARPPASCYPHQAC